MRAPPLLVPTLLVSLAGCESEARVAEEMELALREASEAMVEVLVATEVLAQAAAPADAAFRHGGGACGCPCTESATAEVQSWDGRISEPTEWCAYASDRW